MSGAGGCTLRLPYPVSTNRYWRTFRGRQVVSAEAREYKAEIAAIAAAAGVVPIAGDVSIDIALCAKAPLKPTGKRPRCIDLSNCLKIAEDALQGIAYADDAQTRVIGMRYGPPCRGGALFITVRPS